MGIILIKELLLVDEEASCCSALGAGAALQQQPAWQHGQQALLPCAHLMSHLPPAPLLSCRRAYACATCACARRRFSAATSLCTTS